MLHLETLNLASTNIDSDSISDLCDNLTSITKLKALSLAGNNIEEDVLTNLNYAVGFLPKLEKLNLRTTHYKRIKEMNNLNRIPHLDVF